jgi:hypothetical protein
VLRAQAHGAAAVLVAVRAAAAGWEEEQEGGGACGRRCRLCRELALMRKDIASDKVRGTPTAR